jgi:hypothetical protein
MHVLAEDIHGGAEASGIQVPGDTDRVLYGFPRNVTPCDAPDEALGQEGQEPGYCSINQAHRAYTWILTMLKRALFGVFIALSLFAAPASPNRTEKGYAEFTFARVEFNMSGPIHINREGQEPWEHDYPKSENFFLSMVAQVTGVHTSPDAYKIVQLDSEEIFRYPFLYVSEPGYMDLTSVESENLREYFNRGGFVLFDDFRGEHILNLEDQLLKVFPDRKLQRLELGEDIFKSFYDIDTLAMKQPYDMPTAPTFWGMKDDKGRLILVANNDNDFGEFWEDIDNGAEVLKPAAQAFQFGVSYLIYAMTH